MARRLAGRLLEEEIQKPSAMWRDYEPGHGKAPQAISVRQHLSTSMIELTGLNTATVRQSVAASGGPSGSLGGKERKLEL